MWHSWLVTRQEKEASVSKKSRKENSSKTQALDTKIFNLPLSIVVEGEDEHGHKFKEISALSYIGHQGSSFWIKTPILLGTELKLTIDLPPKLSEGKDLKLIIKGKVVAVDRKNNDGSQLRITIRFGTKYIIQPEK